MAKGEKRIAECPYCGGVHGQGKPMQHHLSDKHNITGMKAHLIANPNDRQAKQTKTGRRTRSDPKRIIGCVDDFDVLEDFNA